MFSFKQLVAVAAAIFIANTGVQAACTTQSPGTEGFNGGKCLSSKTYCGSAPTGGYGILCCDNSSCK
ncbi:hypothetical protein EsH8_I_000234 [Colletotrichum jinshuiense]